MKKLASITFVICALLSSTFLVSTSSAAPDPTKYAWPPKYNEGRSGQPLLGYSFTLVDNFTQNNSGESFSFIRLSTGTQRFCEDFKDAACKNEVEAGGRWWSNQVIPPCIDEKSLFSCIEALNIIHEDGRLERLTYKGLIPGNPWPEDPSISLEASSSSSMWISKEENNPNKGYKVTVSGGLGLSFSDKSTVSRASLSSFQANVEPYEEISGSFQPEQIFVSTDGRRTFSANAPNYCIWVDFNKCGVQSEFPDNKRIQLVLHIPSDITGWLLGRLDQPLFAAKPMGISTISKKPLSRVTLSGFPVQVPLMSVKVENANASREMIEEVENLQFYKDNPSQKTGYMGGYNASSYFDSAYTRFKMFEKFFDDKSNFVLPRWSVRTFRSSDPNYSRCTTGKTESINGIVTTNASIYQGEPPEFDGEEFTYKVAGLHKLPDGNVFKGSYDLALQSDFARCLYNFSNAPIKASVEVTNSDGTSNIATTSFTEKDKWTYLSIKGFTFSQPTIKTKFAQEKIVIQPSPTPTIAPSASPALVILKKSTITCVKGKQTKKVSAVKPKCPTGFKKK